MRHEIHVFSGLGSSLLPSLRSGTKAVEALIDALPYAEADHHIWSQWRRVADAIVDRWKRTKEPFKVALIGHSNGVIATNEIAQHLALRGIKVDYIAAIDPTAARFPDIRSNVHECSEFHASSGWPALTRRFTGNKRAALHFTDAWPGIHRLYHIPGSHVACASNKRVHEVIIGDLERILK
jgi:hypothetical protein